MTPRSKVESLEADDTVADLLEKVRATGHSRFPVTRGDLDETIGVVHLKQVFEIPHSDRIGTRLDKIARAVPTVPSTLDGDALMEQISHTALQTALVADEYGGIAGMVTVEDLIEEIVGDIRDEHDAAHPEVVRITGGHQVSGLLRIDEIADITGFRAPDGDYETIGGLVMYALGHIPAEGDTVELRAFDPDAPLNDPPRWQATVARMDGRRVDLLDLVKIQPDKPQESADG
jgi:CBS domain containing-hemolysin-like protein